MPGYRVPPPILRLFCDAGHPGVFLCVQPVCVPADVLRVRFFNSVYNSTEENTLKPSGLSHLIKPTAGPRTSMVAILVM